MVFERCHDPYWIKGRLSGYRKAMRKAGLEPMPPLIEIPFENPANASSRDIFEARMNYHAGWLSKYLLSSEPIDAIMTLSDENTFGLAEACGCSERFPAGTYR